MLTEAYIDALLVDEELADLVWEEWSAGTINDKQSSSAWLIIAARVDVFAVCILSGHIKIC